MAYTHKFEIDIENEGILEGEIDFDNLNDGIKFTDTQDLSVHIKAMRCIMDMIHQAKTVAKSCGLNKFIIEKKTV